MLKLRMMMIVAIILIISGSGCSGDVRYLSHRLPIDERPDLPEITKDEAKQIPREIWLKVEERDRLRRQYCEGLENTINTNNKKAGEQ